ncbi:MULTISPECIES: hypothetical protein [unclassified Streptomyces]|uniref:hypothetical protein n=1 Tax=unclassified Streptomyces TaxID=2593676 RepID=UPI00148868DB|nr:MULTISPECIES: hypothetical protein [unclassified Streptomyces]
MPAIPVHHTATVQEPWDGPGAMAAAPNEARVLRYMSAWRSADGDPDLKSSYKFPHHEPGTDTAANLDAVRNGLARLSQADIPAADRAGVEAHLRAHLEDAREGR